MATWGLVLIAGWLAATISGAAGFGGALMLLPVLAWVVGAKAAIPILTIAQLMGNLSRAAFGFRKIAWRPVLLFSAGAVPASLAGAVVFFKLPGPLVLRGIGAFLLVMVGLRHTRLGQRSLGHALLVPAGMVVGFLSAIVGSAGPLGAAVFLGLRLAPTAYVASEAVTATAMHLTKSLTYGRFALISVQDLAAGLSLSAAMVLGSWSGRHVIARLPEKWFESFIDVLLVISALSLLFAG